MVANMTKKNVRVINIKKLAPYGVDGQLLRTPPYLANGIVIAKAFVN